jgi:hypothetical protein
MLDPWHISYQDRSKTTIFKTEGLHYIGSRSQKTASPTDAKGLTINHPHITARKSPRKIYHAPHLRNLG